MTKRYSLGFLCVLCCSALAFRWGDWLNLPPASVHQWRQADGAAIAWHYAQNPDFSEVRICNLFYTNDNHAVGELPVLYWLSGWFSRLFHWPPYPLRWIGLALLAAGSWAFGWVVLQLSRNWLVAALSAGVLLTTPVLAYYGPGFLPDAPGFCFVLILLACLVRAHQTDGKIWLVSAGLSAVLAVSLKLSMAILPGAILVAGLAYWRTNNTAQACGWAGKWPPMVALVALVAIGGVRWWIALYNSAHRAMYFLTDIRPVWNYDWPFIRETFWQIGGFGAPAFASAGGYAALGLGLWLTWRNWEKTDRPVRAVLIFVVLGSLFYMVLWFRMLREHDYYFICLLALPALVFLLGLKGALERWSLRRIIVGLTVFWLIGLGYTGLWQNDRLQQAFHPASSLNLPVSAFFPAENPDALGIPPAARLLCPEDPSPNIALLALRRHGWTAYNFGDRITADTLIKYQRHFGLSHLALRNRSNYSVLFKQYFPVTLGRVNGWHLYSTPERLPDGE